MPLSTYTFPSNTASPRIAIVTDYPKKGTDKSVSESYFWNLSANLKAARIDIKTCFLGSILDYYPGFAVTGNTEKKKGKPWAPFNWDKPSVASAVSTLELALDEFQPDVILVLGRLSVNYFKPNPDKTDKERGAPFYDRKHRLCLISYHPMDLFVFHQYTVLAQADYAKAKRLAREKWTPPVYNIKALPTYQEACRMLNKFISHKPYLGTDIETWYDNEVGTKDLTCIGFAYTVKDAIVIPFVGKTGKGRYWPAEQEKVIWSLVAEVLKVCSHVGHNAVHFDFEALIRRNGIVSNFIDDTMFAVWSCYPELLKSLAFASSIFTDNPYWKDELKLARSGKIPFWKEFEYNGRDCIVTLQCAIALGKEMKERGAALRDHYKFNIRVSRAYEYMALNGARVNVDKLHQRTLEIDAKAKQLQEILNDTVGRKINVRSPKQVKELLYNELKLPEKTKQIKQPDGSRKESITADYLTTLYLGKQFPEHPEITMVGLLRKVYKRLSSLQNIKYDSNRRCQWGFNVVGTETGRSSGYKPLNLLGVQPQNVDRRERDIFVPPEGYHWAKADLEGADSVTVAACLEALGDSKLHDDLKAGLKPAQALGVSLLLGDEVMSWPVERIKEQFHLLKGEAGKKMYATAKAVNHGSAYMLSPGGMHAGIFLKSDGDLYILPKECKRSQDLLFARYDYPAYHKQIGVQMRSNPLLKTSHGQERYFFGREDNATLRKMLAYMPQAHTAYVTNHCIEGMYYDKTNRTPTGGLRVPLCNQVHDETDFFIKHGDEDFAKKLFNSHSQVPLKIWGVPFLIEFEAEYGTDWGSQPHTL